MVTNKTTQTQASVSDYVAAIADAKRRDDCAALITLMQQQTGLEPKMWGTSIVGFGRYQYRYVSGHRGEAPLAGLAVRSKALTLYLAIPGEQKQALLAQLGKHKLGKGCLYIQKLADIDQDVLKRLVHDSVEHLRQRYK